MLSNTQIEQYTHQGFALVRGIFTENELATLEKEFDDILERRLRQNNDLDATWEGDWQKKQGQTEILHTHDVQAYSAQWSKFLLHDKLTEVMSDLIGPNVQLHHTKLFYKPPQKGSGFPMHQDHPYFPHEKHTMMAGILHLTDATEANGCVRVYPGTHKEGPLACVPKRNYLDTEKYSIENATICPAKRGDVLFFNYLLIHGSGPNCSDQNRKTVLIQVRDPEDLPTKNIHSANSQGLMLRGINPLGAVGEAKIALETNAPDQAK